MSSRRRIQSPSVDEGEGRRHRPDFVLILIIALLSVLGLVLMYSVSPAIAALNDQPSSFYFSRHATFFVIGCAGLLLSSSLKSSHLKKMVPGLIVVSLVFAFVVLALGGSGSRWAQIGGFSFQPAELIKFTAVVSLAAFLSRKILDGEVADFHKTLRYILFGSAVASGVLVVVQRDLGSTAVLLVTMGVMMFIARVPMRPLILGAIAVVIMAGLAIASTPYRRDRFETFLNPERDCQVQGYHACQALIAVGSGGLFGLGIQNSVQAYGYLPEAATDSIFAIYAEKFGFVGSMVLLTLYAGLLVRMFRIMQRAPNHFMQLIVAGMITWIGVQATVNIGAMIGLLPLKGITLPLISYGGTSLLFVLAGLGLVINISRYTLTRRSLLFVQDTRSETAEQPRRTPTIMRAH